MGNVQVSTAELEFAAGTLRKVDGALAQTGDLGVGARDVGSAELAGAIADFCQRAGSLGTAFAAAVEAAASRTEAAGAGYERTEQGIAGGFGGTR